MITGSDDARWYNGHADNDTTISSYAPVSASNNVI